jgi:hypothetical protein
MPNNIAGWNTNETVNGLVDKRDRSIGSETTDDLILCLDQAAISCLAGA